jgi:hypothetical protein
MAVQTRTYANNMDDSADNHYAEETNSGKPSSSLAGFSSPHTMPRWSATGRAMIGEQTFAGRSEGLSQANKLSRTYAMLLDALNRYRGKGQQKVTVEHVHVHSGGRAIVGTVERTPPTNSCRSENQHDARQITHAPQPAMRCPNAEREANSLLRRA